MSNCRSCNAPIIWVKTERGKNMPLDARPYDGEDPAGLFVIRAGVAVAVPPEAFPADPVYVSHFSTCKQADQWRR